MKKNCRPSSFDKQTTGSNLVTTPHSAGQGSTGNNKGKVESFREFITKDDVSTSYRPQVLQQSDETFDLYVM